ncbi:MAG TPA: histidine phosphatase family protein [Candidatus Saccharimonadales bacterium]|nr:histidine phosphatase family protein [Candidatus Saccharimonadales bacterium]
MTKILLIRHAQSYANKRDFTAFGNEDSPLTDRGIEQALALNGLFKAEFGVTPESYDKPILASTFKRPQQTAEVAGFRRIDINPIINESDVDEEIMNGRDVIKKHCDEHWVPESVKQRASDFIDQVRDNELDYEIYFTHGMFIAAVLLECDVRLIEIAAPFDEKRGYVPLQATITELEV